MAKETAEEGTSPRGRRARAGLVTACAFLIALPIVFYSSMVFRNWEPKAPDTSAAQPFGIWGREFQKETGRTPEWYPYIFCGMPSYGSLMYTPRSPINPVAEVQGLVRDHRGIYYVFLLAIAGLAGFAFLLRQGFSVTASCMGALLYSLTPYIPGSVGAGHSTKIEALSLLPVFLLALDVFLARPDPLRSAALGAAGALLAWSNHPQIVFYGLLIGLLYALGVLFIERRARLGPAGWKKFVLFLLLAVVLSLAMAAEPYLAVKEYAAYSIRGGGGGGGAGGGGGGAGWDYATAWSFHPEELVSFLFPGWFGLQGQLYWGKMPFTQSTHYFGILALLLAVFGLLRSAYRRRWIWGGVSLVVLLIGFGRHVPILYGPMFHLLPLFNKFRVPSMIYSVLPLCLAPLAAAGLDALVAAAREWGARDEKTARSGSKKGGGRKQARPRVATRLAVALGGVLLCWALIALIAGSHAAGMVRPEEARALDPSTLALLGHERASILERSVAQSMVLVLCGLGCLLLAARGAWPRRALAPWLGLVLAALTIGDIFAVGRRFYSVEPKVEPRSEIPLSGAARYLSERPGTFRFLPVDRAIFGSNSFGLLHLQSLGGYQPAKLRAYQDLLAANLIMHAPVLEMLNVRYLLSSTELDLGIPPSYGNDGFVYEFPDSLPRAWSVARVSPLADQPAMLRSLGDDGFQPRSTALVYAGQAPPAQSYAPAAVTLLESSAGRLRLRVENEERAFVVISEMAYPPGWKASLEGRPLPIYRVNHVLQGVEVPPGGGELSLSFYSRARALGVSLSRPAGGLALLLALAGLALERRRKRRGDPPVTA